MTQMNPERHKKLQRLFESARLLDAGARRAWLERQCTDDAALDADVLDLIAHAEKDAGFLGAPAVLGAGGMAAAAATAPTDPGAPHGARGAAPIEHRSPGAVIGGTGERRAPAPERIGPYIVRASLGEGGMGVVYLAQREDDRATPQVAVKLLSRALASPSERQRFERERIVLAALVHPNIARLIDVGTMEDGRPYFVMEYIRGVPIDRYCDENRLTTGERLGLFRKVCSAVQYVHQNLIVHRDIKPANILVTPDGEPKLLDFGIAKLINPAFMPEIDITGPGFRLMTPRYASPEQLRGQPLSTATDIYSLGVLLYELLTGHWPYKMAAIDMRAIERIVCDMEPERPSTALTRAAGPEDTAEVARSRRAGIPKIQRQLRGDIDNVLLKALDKAPQRRYTSAEQFGEDIRRHMEGETVIARAPSFAYKAAKFVRRNRAAVIAAALILVSLVGGLGTALVQWRQAEESRREAVVHQQTAERALQGEAAAHEELQTLARTMAVKLVPQISRLPGAVEARRALAETAVGVLERLSAATPKDWELQLDLASALSELGRTQSDSRSPSIGSAQEAMALQSRVLDIRQFALAAEPGNTLRQVLVGESLVRVADVHRSERRFAEARSQYDEAAALLAPLQDDAQRASAARQRLASAFAGKSECQRFQRDLEGALASAQRAQDVRQKQALADPTSASRRNLSVGWLDFGDLALDAGQSARAIDSYEKAVAVRRDLLRESPRDARSRHDLARALIALAKGQARGGSPAEARVKAEEASRIMDRLVEEEGDQADDRHRQALADALLVLGKAHLAAGDAALAEASLSRAAVLIEPIATGPRALPVDRATWIDVLTELGAADAMLGSLAHAVEIFGRAHDAELAQAGSADATTIGSMRLARIRGLLAETTASQCDGLPDSAAERAECRRRALDWCERAIVSYREIGESTEAKEAIAALEGLKVRLGG